MKLINNKMNESFYEIILRTIGDIYTLNPKKSEIIVKVEIQNNLYCGQAYHNNKPIEKCSHISSTPSWLERDMIWPHKYKDYNKLFPNGWTIKFDYSNTYKDG